MYEDTQYPIRQDIADAHAAAWQTIGVPGPFWPAAARVAFVAEARAALRCALCRERLAAMSPGAVQGAHDHLGTLPTVVVDMIHRIRTDPGRITKAMFDGAMAAGLDEAHYVEIVSVVTTSVIVDTMHTALGLEPPPLPVAQDGAPTGQPTPELVDEGAWLPLAVGDRTMRPSGMPAAPNIVRAMGAVPAAVALFFGAFRPHYALSDLPLDLSQSQAEFVASRVSALNQCFY